MGQGTVKVERRAGFWALTVSIAVHLLVLAVLAATKFSPSKADAQMYPGAVAKMSRIQKLAETPRVIPKPKISRPEPQGVLPADGPGYSDEGRIFDIEKTGDGTPGDLTGPAGSEDIYRLEDADILQGGVDFFGSKSRSRRICYVVDRSGSMRGLLGRVKTELARSIADLQPDQYFAIIFFGGGTVTFGDGKLIRATQHAKKSAQQFIKSVEPRGTTNALTAIDRALRVRDGSGAGASVVYLLTDGFELGLGDAGRFRDAVETLRRSFAPQVKINTIGFWPGSEDRKLLKKIAVSTGGEFVIVADDDGSG